ncbi:hypothetical protein [Acinetobacter brisouii]
MSERDIALAAARVLRECFIQTAKSNTVLYVENDNLMSKAPDQAPVFIKKIKGRNPYIVRETTSKKTFKLKKRCIE